tara:strand:- start:1995 stop:2480 length:486 start_codon:yes stop_codon:yes gene_type:complete
VALRTIGHEFLLELNYSNSRVMPIEKIGERYAVKFEREFSFEPDLLEVTPFKVLEESKLADSYIVEIEKCGTTAVIHSFNAISAETENRNICELRELPLDCYVFYFTIVENMALEETRISATVISIFAILFLIVGGYVIFYLFGRKKKAKVNTDLIHIGLF